MCLQRRVAHGREVLFDTLSTHPPQVRLVSTNKRNAFTFRIYRSHKNYGNSLFRGFFKCRTHRCGSNRHGDDTVGTRDEGQLDLVHHIHRIDSQGSHVRAFDTEFREGVFKSFPSNIPDGVRNQRCHKYDVQGFFAFGFGSTARKYRGHAKQKIHHDQ